MATPAVPAPPVAPAVPPPLGLPPGSVRAILALVMSGTLWYMVLQDRIVPEILVEAVLLVVGFYFGVRQGTAPALQPAATVPSPATTQSPATPPVKPPLRLPRGSVRVILLLGFFGTIAYMWNRGRGLPDAMILILQVLASYILGYMVSALVHRRRLAGLAANRVVVAFRNLNAVAVIGVTSYVCASFAVGWAPLFPEYTSNLLAWTVAYYFGSRLPS